MMWIALGLAAYLAIATITFLYLNGVVYPNWSLRAAFSKNDETRDMFVLALKWPRFALVLISIVFGS